MKRLTRKILVLMAVLFIGSTASKAEWFSVGKIYYNVTSITNLTVEVTYRGDNYWWYNEYSGSVIIPETVTFDGNIYSVTSIRDEAFRCCDFLTSVTIPNSVTSIGNCAFSECTSLTSVTIGNSVTSIGEYAFSKCSSLTSVAIPNSVTSIEYSAFSECTSLTSVAIPNSVTSIGSYAFSKCSSLTSVAIPNSVTSIGKYTFWSCSSLTSVTIPNSVTSIGDGAFNYCPSLTSVTIPNSVTSIGSYAFEACSSLTFVKFLNSMTYIGDYAFSGCSSLTSLAIGQSVTSIGIYAFRGCSSLTSVTIPNSVTSIKDNAFYGCTLTPLYINNTDAIRKESLKGLNLSSVILVSNIEDVAKVKPYFEGGVYPNTAYCVDSLRSYLGGVEFSLWNNIYDKKKEKNITGVIVDGNSLTPNEEGFYSIDGLMPDSSYQIGICYKYNPLTINIQRAVAAEVLVGRDTIRTEISTLEPDWQLNHVLNSTYSTCEIQIHWNSDKTVSPSEWGAYVLERDVSISVSEEEFKEKQIKLKGKKIKANLDGVINATGLQPDKEYYFWPYAIYNGKEYLEIWDYIPVKTQLPQLGITDLNITQTTYEAQITASEDEYSSPSEKGIYLKVYSLDEEEWVKYKADSTGKVKVTGLLPYKSYCVRPYAIYNWKEITQLENYDRDYKHITTKPIKPFTNKQAPYSVNHINLSVSSGTLDSDLSVVELGVRLSYSGTDYPANSDKTVTIGNLTPGQYITIYPYVVVKYASTGETTKVIGGYENYTSLAPYISNIDYVTSATTIKVNEMEYELYDGTFKECGFSTPYVSVGNKAFFTGLNPGEKYDITGYLIVEEGNYKATLSRSVTTPALILTTLPAKATSNSKAVICAETNIANEETGTGFEFRRIDAPDLVPSTVVYCAVHDGVMEGILNNLSSNTYYKYRPFYKSASGKMYYGEWIGFGTADAYVYFTPTVHTYATAGVENNSVTLNGYALPGSDDVLEQGFEYWTDGITRAAANGVQTVTATGQRMTITLNDLQYNTTYRYRAYVKTAKETTYGEEMTFTTGAAPSGIGEVATEELDVEVRTLSGGSLELRLSGAETTTARYALYTPNGVSVVVGELTSVGEWQPIGDSSLSQGFYLLRVENNKLCRTVKVMVK